MANIMSDCHDIAIGSDNSQPIPTGCHAMISDSHNLHAIFPLSQIQIDDIN